MEPVVRSSTWAVRMLALSAALAACSMLASGEGGELRPIAVEDVRVDVGVGSPIPVEVLVSGTWPDLCAQLAEVTQTIVENEVRITLLASEANAGCPPDHLGLPFRIAVPLNVVELPQGEYHIDVNGMETNFEWSIGSTTSS